MKDFDTWNVQKKELDGRRYYKYAHIREIWWCSLGINIGVEIDGKNANFERPVVVIKMYNKEMMIILPLTTKYRNDAFHYKIQTKERTVWAKLTQMRVIDHKRLLRKVDVLDEQIFLALREAWKAAL